MSLRNPQTDEGLEDLVYGRRSKADMVHIPGGTFCMGSDKHYPEEAPVHHVTRVLGHHPSNGMSKES